MEYLNDLASECHNIAQKHGFWDHLYLEIDDAGCDSIVRVENPSIWAEKIALIHSEASEMLECLRKNKGEAELAIECADLLIRLLDFVGARDINIHDAVQEKMRINIHRERLHGGNF